MGINHVFEYVCKGPGRVILELFGVPGNQLYDEITHFQNVKFVCAFEALRWLCRYDLAGRSPLVVRLDVHIEIYHTLYFCKGLET